MKELESPCKFCSDREPGCHTKCNDYKKYKFTVKVIKSKKNEWKKNIPFETSGFGPPSWDTKK